MNQGMTPTHTRLFAMEAPLMSSSILSLSTLLPSRQPEALSSGPGSPMFEQHGPTTRIRRAPVRAFASVTFEGGPREIFGQVLNLSPGGCLLRTETTIPEGTELEMHVTIVGRGERSGADVKAIVRRATTDEGRRAYGIEFISEEREETRTLQWLYARAMSRG